MAVGSGYARLRENAEMSRSLEKSETTKRKYF